MIQVSWLAGAMPERASAMAVPMARRSPVRLSLEAMFSSQVFIQRNFHCGARKIKGKLQKERVGSLAISRPRAILDGSRTGV